MVVCAEEIIKVKFGARCLEQDVVECLGQGETYRAFPQFSGSVLVACQCDSFFPLDTVILMNVTFHVFVTVMNINFND